MLRINRKDAAAAALLVVLWALFFWQVLTPVDADRASFKQGDFSGQFVAFGAYQYERFTDGEIPLWNPYNNSGLPFVADTQAAVFYPPRLLTIALARLADGWSYHALELEAAFHVLGYTLATYALVRRLTGDVFGGVFAALIGGYGGYLSGYPPLQLALLEAGVWLPLVILALYEGVRADGLRWQHLLLAGFTLGVSWLAGHPQTSWFLTYLAVAYLAFRLWAVGAWSIRRFAGGGALLGAVTFGVTAVTLLPGIEYLARTARGGMGYATKTNGFPLQDVVQMVYPGTVSMFSPLYIGVIGLVLVAVALRHRSRELWFWLGTAVFGLLWSFGGNTALFDVLYNTLPGLRYFRGQERAAYLFANSLAIIGGHAALYDLTGEERTRFTRLLRWLLSISGGIFVVTVILWWGFPAKYGAIIGPVTLTGLVLLALAALLRFTPLSSIQFRAGVAVLLAFELFSVNMGAPSNYDQIPPADQLSLTPPPLIAPVVGTGDDPIQRVDGFRGLTDNYGSLYGVYDARGISPLFLDGLDALQRPPFAAPSNFETNPTFWELNAVRYVYSSADELPVTSTIIERGADRFGPVKLHRLTDPRPFAQLVYAADVVDSDAFARALLADPAYNPRETAILHADPSLELLGRPPNGGQAVVTSFEPEAFTVEISTPQNAVLTLAHPDYPGWRATLNGEATPLLRAYGGFSAVMVPAGEHTLTLRYLPRSFQIGAGFSLATWAILGIIGLATLVRRHTANADREPGK